MPQIGNYNVVCHHKNITLQVEDKAGELVRMRMKQIIFQFTHMSGDIVIFKRHKHCGVWKWSDSRVPGSQTAEYVIGEVARLLFRNDKNLAFEMLRHGLAGVSTVYP